MKHSQDHVNNGRIEELRVAAEILKGKKVSEQRKIFDRTSFQ